jgi:predicted Zn-dependent peptidase
MTPWVSVEWQQLRHSGAHDVGVGRSHQSRTIPAMFERTVLPAGPRVISTRLAGARSVSVAAFVRAGSRLETREQAGMAHFLEHLTFKGTAAFPSTRTLSEAIEGVGGSFNAATDREATVYWVRVPRRETKRAMTVLGELICRPNLDVAEIDREREVIVEEIRGYLDDPAEYAQILFQQAMFGPGALGREICGEESDVRGLPADGIRAFWAATYRPANAVVAVAGDLGHDEALELAATTFGRGNGVVHGFEPAPTLPAGDRVLTGRRDTTQAQICIGVPALQRDHPDAWALAVLNAVLGDGMSSRLFLALVDRDALAYDVGSGIVEYADAGALQVTAGVDPGRAGKALDGILHELASLRDAPVDDDELRKAKAYMSGGLELRMEETRHLAAWIGGQEALHDRVLTLDDALAAIARVTADDVTRLARQLFRDDALRMAVVAPARSLRGLDKHLRLVA